MLLKRKMTRFQERCCDGEEAGWRARNEREKSTKDRELCSHWFSLSLISCIGFISSFGGDVILTSS